MKIKLTPIVLFLIWTIIGLNIQQSSYSLVFCIYFIGIYCFFRTLKVYGATSFLSTIPFIFLFVWAYGVCLGFYNNNRLDYIISNFAGMTVFGLYYVLKCMNISKEKLAKIVVAAAITTSVLSALSFISALYHMNLYLGEISGGSSTGQLRQMFINQNVSVVAWCICLVYLLGNKRIREQFPKKYSRLKVPTYFLLFCYFTFTSLFIPASKGFLLAGIFYFSSFIYLLFYQKLRKGIMPIRVLLSILLIFVLCLILLLTGYVNIIGAIFDTDDEANIPRFVQLEYLLDDLCLQGKGLGAIIEGYTRSNDKEYGFELIYINLFHKFGILALLLLFSYVYIVAIAIKRLYKEESFYFSLIAFSNMAFLFPSLGNPMLFSPSLVLLTCISIYLLE